MSRFLNIFICGASSFVPYEDMACHTWALSGSQTSGRRTNERYVQQMDEFGGRYAYGTALGGRPLVDVREECIESLRRLCARRKRLTGHRVYLCGGFREGQVCPEHLWLEDHTAGWTYDTFIGQPIRRVNRVGGDHQPFQPGCEARPFDANGIARIRVDGFTIGQHESILRYSEDG